MMPGLSLGLGIGLTRQRRALSPAERLLSSLGLLDRPNIAAVDWRYQSIVVHRGGVRTFNGDVNDFFENTAPPTQYIRNSSGFYVPGTTLRTHHDADGNPLGLLVEEQRTNLNIFPTQFDHADWIKSGSSVVAGSDTPPIQGLGSFEVIEDTSTGVHVILDTIGAWGSSNKHASKGLLKAHSRSSVRFVATKSAGVYAVCYFNLATGTVGGSSGIDAAYIQHEGNGWYTCEVVFTPTAGQTGSTVWRVSDGVSDTYTGDGSSRIRIAATQTEEGARSTSWILSGAGSQVTRAANDITLPLSLIPWDPDQGTIIVEVGPSAGDVTRHILNVSSDGDGSRHQITYASNGSPVYNLVDEDGNIDTLNLSNGVGTKFALAFAKNDVALSTDGAAVATSSTADPLPTSPDKLYIGQSRAGATQLNSYIKSIVYIPERLTNAELQALSA